MKYILFTITLIGLFSCKKDPDTPPPPAPATTSNEPPTITITQPTDNFTVDLGQSFSLEGTAYDKESLASVNYSIQTPNASYNYTTSNNYSASGTSYNFNESITIPTDASVGDAVLTVFSKDSENSQSSSIARNFRILDKIAPIQSVIKNTVGFSDLIVLNVFQNTNGVIDSVTVYNQTKSETLATITDIGGFKTIICSIIQDGGPHSAPVNSTTSIYDLTTTPQASYSYQINHPGGVSIYYLSIGFREYDNTMPSSISGGDSNLRFDFL